MTLDEKKTKPQLIEELVELRRRCAEYEGAEEALRDSETRYRGIAESVPTSIVIVDHEGRTVDISRHHVAHIGRGKTSKEDYVGQILSERPSVIAAGLADDYRAVLRGTAFRKEGVLFPQLSGGHEGYFDVSGMPLIKDGEVTGAVFVHQDVSDRKRAEAALLESEERHRTLFETMTQGVVYQDAQGNITSANAAAQRILGLTLDQMCGRTSLDPRWKAVREDGSDFPGDEHPTMVSLRTGAPKRGAVMGVFCPIDNTERWISIDSIPLFREGEGRPFQVYATFTDITARKKAEDALRESEARLRRAQRVAGMGFLDWNLETDIIELSSEAIKMFGVEAHKQWTTPEFLEQVCHPDDKQQLAKRFGLAISGEKDYNVDHRIVCPDGEVRWVHAQAVLKRDEEGTPVRLLSTVVDITDRKREEQERLDLQLRVQHAQKLESLETLAGGIAHDFNNLLMGVLGNAELALSNIPASSPARGDIESARQAASRAAELANQMLAYSGKGRFVTEAINLSEIAASMVHLFEASLPKTTIVNCQLDEQIPPIEGDKTQIRQVILAFVTNASEALESQQGVVKITTGTMKCDKACLEEIDIAIDGAEGRYAFLEVADKGIGMDAATLSNIFDPFFTTKFTGRGLGLAAVFGIVRGHGGGIKVESEPGKGTTIRALFPVSEKPAEPPQIDDETLVSASVGDTVLLVDDEPSVLEVGIRMLAMAGLQVRTARDGYEAVEVFKQHADDIACVVLDLTMPKMDGEETFNELQKIRDDVPILLSSGYTVEEVEARISMRGFAGFIKKPYTKNQLMKHVRRALDAD